MKVLFISYLFDPDPGVAAKRISYWAQNFKDLEPGAEVHLITATDEPSANGIDKVYIAKSTSKPFLEYIIKDPGVAWSRAIKSILKGIGISDFSHVIFTGSPFMQFALAGYIKNNSNAKVILDYRDPFAVNPRFNNHPLKIWIKKIFERDFNKKADVVLSVNQYCVELLQGYRESPSKYFVIRNGFNEKSTPSTGVIGKKKKEVFELVYAGSFYSDRNPENLLKVLDQEQRDRLCHLGKTSAFLKGSDKVNEMGIQPYQKTLKTISEKDAGLIITSGEPFESTTKIYDYIAMKIPVLVITSGKEHTGALEDELKGYPSVWCQNNEEDIRRGIKNIKKLRVDEEIDVDSYSRKEGLKKLISIMKTNSLP